MSSNPFTQMRELFGPAGENWCKGTYEDPDTGAKCLVGAARVVVHGWLRAKYRNPILETLSEGNRLRAIMNQVLLAKYGADGVGVVAFNDALQTTFADIEWLLGECETAWEMEQDASG